MKNPKDKVVADAFKSIREFLNEYQLRFENLEKRLDNLALEPNCSHGIDKFIETLTQQQERLNIVENIAKNLAQRQTNFNVLEERINCLEQQNHFHILETQIENLNKGQQTNLEGLEKQIRSLVQEQTQFAVHKQSIHTLENRLEQFDKILPRLDILETQLNCNELFSTKIAEILPSAINQVGQQHTHTNSRVELSNSLQEPVEQCIRQSISQNTRPFADTLFPIMGPAIRKSIRESLKSIIQNINKTVEQSLSLQGIVWRIEALRTGCPFSEIVLKHILIYQIEQVFLIHRESGLLIQHIHQESIEIGDSDAVSAMFTAIQDFIRDSFSASKVEELDSVEIGDYTVWLERGPYAVLACVIRGIAPYHFRELMRSSLETIHAFCGTLLKRFDGDNLPLQACQPLLAKFLQSQSKPTTAKTWRLSPQLSGILGILLLALFGWGYFSFQYQQRLTNYIQALRNTPGIVVISTEFANGKTVIYGMRDPLAKNPRKIALHYELSDDDIESFWTSYQNFSPQFVKQRLMQQLSPPATVSVNLQNNILSLKGHASSDWITKAKNIPLVTGVQQIDMNKLFETDRFLLNFALHKLSVPQNVTLAVQKRILQINGYVDSLTSTTLLKQVQDLPISPEAYAAFDTTGLIYAESEITRLVQLIHKLKIYFRKDSTEFVPQQKITLQTLYKYIQRLLTFSQALSQQIHLQIIGNTDGRGAKIRNQKLAIQRAQKVKKWLFRRGIKKLNLTTPPPTQIHFDKKHPDPKKRNVSFKISIT